MHAITAGAKKINDVKVETFSRNVKHKSTDIDVEAGTTGFRGYVPARRALELTSPLTATRATSCSSPSWTRTVRSWESR